MDFDDRLRLYKRDRFSDHDVTRCTDLSVRAWRELIKVRAVRTVTEDRGRGRVRLCDAVVFKRAALIAALNRAGLSLAVSGRVAYFLPLHTMLYTVCDPLTILFQPSAGVDPKTGLPPRYEQPKADWFDPDKPAQVDPETDWLIEIYEGRFVGAIYNAEDGPTIFGDLRHEGTSFVAWVPRRRQIQLSPAFEEIAHKVRSNNFIEAIADWEDPTKWPAELKSLGYIYEQHDTDGDSLRIDAAATTRGPLFKTTINASLAIRIALRRYLGGEPGAPGSEMDEPA
jgi:hypothetical protein